MKPYYLLSLLLLAAGFATVIRGEQSHGNLFVTPAEPHHTQELQPPSNDSLVEVVILHVNDMHSQIREMGKLAYLADSLRRIHPYLLLVSAGDNFTGNPLVDMVKDKGAPMIDLMNRCGFDLTVIGNHEFDMGQKLLDRKMKQAGFPFVCCNLDASGAGLGQPAPYAVLQAGENLEIPFLGIIQLGENGLPDSHPSRLTGIAFTDGVEAAGTFTWLKNEYPALVALSHLGMESDVRLANALPAFDAIIGGHSHTVLDTALLINNVMITQAGSYLRYAGKLTLRFLNDSLVSRSDTLIALAMLPGTDQAVEKQIRRISRNKQLQKVLSIATDTISGKPELGSLMTDALTDQLQLDFAFQNRGGIRIGYLPEGPVRLIDIYRLDPFGNRVITYLMTLDEIASLIGNAYNRGQEIDLEVSGMTYRVITGADGRCSRVEMMLPNGSVPEPALTYSVGMNSYMAASYTFDHTDPGKELDVTGSELLIRYLKKQQKVSYRGVCRAFSR